MCSFHTIVSQIYIETLLCTDTSVRFSVSMSPRILTINFTCIFTSYIQSFIRSFSLIFVFFLVLCELFPCNRCCLGGEKTLIPHDPSREAFEYISSRWSWWWDGATTYIQARAGDGKRCDPFDCVISGIRFFTEHRHLKQNISIQARSISISFVLLRFV